MMKEYTVLASVLGLFQNRLKFLKIWSFLMNFYSAATSVKQPLVNTPRMAA